MNALAIDIGTHCGYAYNHGDDFHAGTWHLMTAKEVTAQAKVRLNRRKDARIKRLCDYVNDLGTFDVIIFEDVNFVSTTYQAHLWAGLRSAIWLCGIAKHFDCVPVKTLKKFATSNGEATKDAMGAALKQRHPSLWRVEHSDDAIDAIWLWLWAQKNLARIGQPGIF